MVRILLVGTGAMAERHALSFNAIPGVTVAAGVDPNTARLAAFCERFAVPHAFTDLEEAMRWDGFDAVSNVTPDNMHHPMTMRLVEAMRPIFCEKPLAPTFSLALEMTEEVERRGLINMVNLRYRGLAVIQKARSLVADGVLGEIRHVDAAYLQSWLIGQHWGDWRSEERWLWRLSAEHGSKGVLGDVGIHIIDLASFVAGQFPASIHCRLQSFPKAEGNRIGPYPLDANDSFVLSVAFDGGALGVIHASRWMAGYANAQKLAVYGSRGALEILFESERSNLRLCAGEDVHTQTWRDVECPPAPLLYDTFIEAVRTGVRAEPSFRRATELQRVIDLCFATDESGVSVHL